MEWTQGGKIVNREGNFYIVHKKILPEVIKKTVEVNELLNKVDGITINEAVKRVGISRSAYYKYKDHIQPFYQLNEASIVTIYLLLDHTSGVLSCVLTEIAKIRGNILTINQNIPLQGIANVTVSVDIEHLEVDLENFIELLKNIPGVRKVGLIAQN